MPNILIERAGRPRSRREVVAREVRARTVLKLVAGLVTWHNAMSQEDQRFMEWYTHTPRDQRTEQDDQRAGMLYGRMHESTRQLMELADPAMVRVAQQLLDEQVGE